MNFADAAERYRKFAAELPRFQAAVWNIFNPSQGKLDKIRQLLTWNQQTDRSRLPGCSLDQAIRLEGQDHLMP